jgi:hypothetical protein
MRLILLLLPAVLVLATPAAAQISGYGGVSTPSSTPIGGQLRQIEGRIERGRDNDQLSRREGRQLRREARQVEALRQRYSHGGLSEGERRELQARVDYLRDAVGVQRSRPRRARR